MLTPFQPSKNKQSEQLQYMHKTCTSIKLPKQPNSTKSMRPNFGIDARVVRLLTPLHVCALPVKVGRKINAFRWEFGLFRSSFRLIFFRSSPFEVPFRSKNTATCSDLPVLQRHLSSNPLYRPIPRSTGQSDLENSWVNQHLSPLESQSSAFIIVEIKNLEQVWAS